MAKSNIYIEFLGEAKTVFVRFQDGVPSKRTIAEFKSLFQELLFKGYSKWVVDIHEIPFPSNSLMAYFIAATTFCRAQNGEFTLTNVNESAKNNFATFSPLSFLSIMSENEALSISNSKKAKVENKTTSTELPSVDISESEIHSVYDDKLFHDDETSSIIIDDDVFSNDHHEPSSRSSEFHTVSESIKVDSTASELYKICDFVVEHALAAGIDEKEVGKIKISVYEACLNVIEHAYHSRSGNSIQVDCKQTPEHFQIVITDFGHSFRTRRPKSYDVENAVENRQTGGFGMHIIERSMDQVEYSSDVQDGNQLTLTKNLPS